MGLATSTQTNVLATGESHVEMLPRGYRAGSSYGIIYAHGYGQDHLGPIPPNVVAPVLRALSLTGMPLISGQFGGNTWGNDTAIDRMDAAYDRLVELGARTDGVVLIGLSMGFFTITNWAKRNKSKVKALIGIVPACDLQLCHDDLAASATIWAPSIEAAYGGNAGYLAALPDHDPQLFKDELKGIPIRIEYNSGDTVQVPANQIAWGNYMDATLVDSPGNHTPANIDIPQFVTWTQQAIANI